jgi:hypothetical protein
MNAQLALTFAAPVSAADWARRHPEAVRIAVEIARKANAAGRKCSYRLEVLPVLLMSGDMPKAGEESPYSGDHNEISGITRHLEAEYGVEFTKRQSRHDPATGPRECPWQPCRSADCAEHGKPGCERV